MKGFKPRKSHATINDRIYFTDILYAEFVINNQKLKSYTHLTKIFFQVSLELAETGLPEPKKLVIEKYLKTGTFIGHSYSGITGTDVTKYLSP